MVRQTNSFTVTRNYDGNNFAQDSVLAIEGERFNGEEVDIRVDLADFASNPVPDGTLVNFRAELGDIEESCSTVDGACEVKFISSEPRTPTNTEVSFKNLDDDNCPSNLIIDETVTVNGGGNGLTDYRVDEILRVALTGSTILTNPTNYIPTANGIDCVTCTSGQVLDITYRRLWLDEEDDGSDLHVIAEPGVATEPFLDVVGVPCTAPARENLVEITGSINPTGSTSVNGSGTAFRTDLAVGDRLKVNQEIRTITAVSNDTSLTVDTAFSDTGNDLSPERVAAPAYLGGMGQPYGGRSSLLAYTLGEESFVDANGNDEYDFGESFDDLAEAFLDKNEDGVLGDVNADSATAGTLGPYRDAGLGTDAPGEASEKADPYCYGPRTIIGTVGDGDESTEADQYCFQIGGEEELFIDGGSANGVMDVGNGIYNGSRCLRPLQDADGIDQGGDGDFEDDTVCSTELVNISRQVEILMAGSFAETAWRAGSTGGTYVGWGEIIQGIGNRAGNSEPGTVADPTGWTRIATNLLNPATLGSSHPGAPFGGALVDTSILDSVGSPGSADSDELVALFEIADPFPTTYATYTVSFEIVEWTTGQVEVYVGSQLIIPACTGIAAATATCTANNISLTATDPLRFIVVDEDPAATVLARFQGTITNVTVTGTSTGINGDFQSTQSHTSNDKTNAALTEFGVGDTINSTTVFPGVSEREAASGTVPQLTTTLTSGILTFTDKFNGQLPQGTVVKIESSNATGCSLTSVGGTSIDIPVPGPTTGGVHSGEVTVGTTATTWTSYTV